MSKKLGNGYEIIKDEQPKENKGFSISEIAKIIANKIKPKSK